MTFAPLDRWRRRRSARRELDALTDRELAELGLFRCDIPRVARDCAIPPRDAR